MFRFSTGKLAAVGLAALMVCGASAQIAKQGNGYLFRMKFTKGQAISYVMHMTSQAPSGNVEVTAPMSQKTTDVTRSKDGPVATMTLTIGKMSMLMNGKPLDFPAASKPNSVSMQIDSLGHVAGGKESQTSVAMPEKPIPVGGSWSANTNVAQMGQSMQASATYKLLGFQKMGGFNAAKLSVSVLGAGQLSMKGSGTLWLDTRDGSLIKNTMKLTITMGKMVIPSDVSVTRK